LHEQRGEQDLLKIQGESDNSSTFQSNDQGEEFSRFKSSTFFNWPEEEVGLRRSEGCPIIFQQKQRKKKRAFENKMD
jgi:hypothetical protein